MTPEALRRRMAHGNIYGPRRSTPRSPTTSAPGNLAALRELALLWVADKVDESLQQYMEDHGITGAWETRERIVVALTGAPGRRTPRPAGGAHGDAQQAVICSACTSGRRGPRRAAELPSDGAPRAARRTRRHATTRSSAPTSPRRSSKRHACEHATQLVLGSSRRCRWAELMRGSVINR